MRKRWRNAHNLDGFREGESGENGTGLEQLQGYVKHVQGRDLILLATRDKKRRRMEVVCGGGVL